MTAGMRIRRAGGWTLAGVAALLATGCGGGDGGGVAIGSGQDPDPAVLDVPIAYVRRPLPLDDQGAVTASDLRELRTFAPGADLYVRRAASPSAEELNVTGELTQGLYDIRDLDTAYDGSRIIFAMRGPFEAGVPEEDLPTWNIWEYDIGSGELARVIASDITAEAGHDVAPYYLPDGRIVFSSTRQRQAKALLLDEGKPQFDALDESFNEPAFVLHVMNSDGSDIHQVSFNQSHDLDPSVLANGQVLFSRWDNAGTRNAVHLYRMNPDGTGLELLYGANSHATGTDGATIQFVQPRELADGRILAVGRPFAADSLGGGLLFIDTPNYVENTQPTAANAGVLAGPAQTPATVNEVYTDGGISPGGSYGAAYPLLDGTDRMFVSWSQCRLANPDGTIDPCTPAALADPNAVAAPPLYGLWIYDPARNTQLPLFEPEEGFIYTDVVAAQVRPLPPVIYDAAPSGLADPALVAEGTGLISIRSVYDVDGIARANIAALADPAQTTAAERPARFLRIEKAVAIPDNDVLDFDDAAFGISRTQGMREILGYVPIEPDGSVVVKVPADVPIALSVLDADGRRTSGRHQSWLQLRPGQMLACNGCHNPGSGLSHGRAEAFASAWAGASTTAQPFPNTDPAIFADFGETMAEARARISCATDCAAIVPSVDVVYTDVWTDEAAAGRAKDPDLAYRYADLATPAPASVACQAAWSPACRTVINYAAHLHPLWSVPRQVLAADGVTVLEDRSCIACHSPLDALGGPRVPAAQLDLSDGPSAAEANQLKSYRELLVGDNDPALIDPVTGLPVTDPVSVDPPMSTAGARASTGFFSRFDSGGSHAGWLSPAELRLIGEWLDLGAQNYNNPFDAPVN